MTLNLMVIVCRMITRKLLLDPALQTTFLKQLANFAYGDPVKP